MKVLRVNPYYRNFLDPYETTTRRLSFSEEISPEKRELLILMRRGGHKKSLPSMG
ncbi:MAG: hypothetical protein QXF12_01580 [Candidatus Aenigmatarchaeota archaeon]